MKFNNKSVLVLALALCYTVAPAFGQYRRNTGIMNTGWIWSLPYDLSETLRAPLGGPLSLILTGCLSIIMFFGLAASPVWYFLNTPPRHYGMKDAVQIPALSFVDGKKKSIPRGFPEGSLPFDQPSKNGTASSAKSGEDTYIDHLFRFINEDEETCRKLMVCHSHGFLSYMPSWVLKTFSLFSSKTRIMPKPYQEAIKVGFAEQGNCQKVYKTCSKSLPQLLGRIMFGSWSPFRR